MIRQRKNSAFFATPRSARTASRLCSLIATCLDAGVNAFDYLVAIVSERDKVAAHPEQYLPWNFLMRG